jgi:catechol 2,3-dioxygenase-like lactoylglutathione lyase family enzyme
MTITPAVAKFAAITIDCPDPDTTAAFYTSALGGTITHRLAGGTFIEVDGLSMIFRRVADYQAPTWPSSEVPMQMHFELYVDDLAGAEARLHQFGASTPEHEDDSDTGLLVMLDPAGHPFCIIVRPEGSPGTAPT